MSEERPYKVWVSWGYTATEGGWDVPGQENDSYPNRAPEHKTHEVFGVFTTPSDDRGWNKYNEECNVSFDPTDIVYVVVVTYQTGDTFGYSTGNVSIVDVFNEEETACEVAASIREKTFPGYTPWNGYFEALESVRVHKFKLDSWEVKSF